MNRIYNQRWNQERYSFWMLTIMRFFLLAGISVNGLGLIYGIILLMKEPVSYVCYDGNFL
jgi:hypothetical protein